MCKFRNKNSNCAIIVYEIALNKCKKKHLPSSKTVFCYITASNDKYLADDLVNYSLSEETISESRDL